MNSNTGGSNNGSSGLKKQQASQLDTKLATNNSQGVKQMPPLLKKKDEVNAAAQPKP